MSDDESDSGNDFSASEDEWTPGKQKDAEVDSYSSDAEADALDDDFEITPPSKKKRSSLEQTRSKKTRNSSSLRTKMFKKYRPPPKTNTNSKPSIAKVQSEKNSKDDEDSDSGSSGDDCLVNPNQIDLKSSFFNVNPSTSGNKPPDDDPPNFDCNAGMKLSDSEEDDEEFDEVPNDGTKKDISPFKQFYDYTKNVEQVKDSLKKYEEKSALKKDQNVDISSLLAMGETSTEKIKEKLKKIEKKKLEHHSDSDWEEVEEDLILANKSHKDGIEVTVALPQLQRREKKMTDEQAQLMRKLNRIIKENCLIFHKVSLLCHIAHGIYLNKELNNTSLLSAALKLLPNDKCYPDGRTDIKYFESICKWYKATMQIKTESVYSGLKNRPPIPLSLALQIKSKEAICKKDYVLIFISLLRAMGIQCRLILNLVPLPLRPLQSDLCTIKLKKPEDVKSKVSGVKQTKKESTDKNVKQQTKKNENNENKSSKDKKNEKDKNTQNNESKNLKVEKSKIENSKTKVIPSKKIAAKNTKESSSVIVVPKIKLTDCDTKNNVKIEPSTSQTIAQPKKRSRSLVGKNNDEVVKPEKNTTKKSTEKASTSETKVERVTRSNRNAVTQNKNLPTTSAKTRKSKSVSPVPTKEKDIENPKKEKKSKSRSPSPKFHISPLFCQTGKNGINKIENNITSKKTSTGTLKNKLSVPQLDGGNDDDDEIPKKKPRKTLKEKLNVKKSKNIDSDNTDDSDFVIAPPNKKSKLANTAGPVNKVLEKVSARDRRVLSTDLDDEDNSNNSNNSQSKKSMNIWVEVYSEMEDQWVTIDLFKSKVHCVDSLRKGATAPVSYVFAWNNDNSLKDVSARYCPQWNTVTRKQRVEKDWLDEAIKKYIAKKKYARDLAEDRELEKIHMDKPLPTTINEYKNHPLYALERHLLKFEAIYPPNALTVGFVRGEPVYCRDCVHTLHSREIWLKSARVVKPGQTPYKIVKARPKWDRLTSTVIKDQPLEIFGYWQTMEYDPPTAENGIVPRNAYGNVELFKPTMLPKKTVHLQLPGLNRVCKKLQIDCAPAVIGFDFHQGSCHPMFDGFVVCEEFGEIVTEAWGKDQEEQERKEQEKYEQRVYGNWKKLIKGLLIRERLKLKYNFGSFKEADDKPKKKK